jgi:hypothetical protein
MAVLCDGETFSFYKFINKHYANLSPQISLGKFPDGSTEVGIDDTKAQGPSHDAFYRKLRKACDAFYYVFLNGYRTGLEAYWKASMERGKAQGKPRDSTPEWQKAIVYATEALEEAISAWNLYNDGMLTESKASAEKAVQFLAERYIICPLL